MFKSGIIRSMTRAAKGTVEVRRDVCKVLLACALRVSECRVYLSKVPNFAKAVGLRPTDLDGESAANGTFSVDRDDILLWAIAFAVADSSFTSVARGVIVSEIAIHSSGDMTSFAATKKFIDSLSTISRALTALDSARPILSQWEHWGWLKGHLDSVDERLRAWGPKSVAKQDLDSAAKKEVGDETHEVETSEFVEEKAIEMMKKVRQLIRKLLHIGSKSD